MTGSSSSPEVMQTNKDPLIVDKLWRLKLRVEKELGYHVSFTMLMNQKEYQNRILLEARSSSSKELSSLAKDIVISLRDKPRKRSEGDAKVIDLATQKSIKAPLSEGRYSFKNRLILILCVLIGVALFFTFAGVEPFSTTSIASSEDTTATVNNFDSPNTTDSASLMGRDHVALVTNAEFPTSQAVIEGSQSVAPTVRQYFSLAGSNTVGEKLAPALVEAWLKTQSNGAMSVAVERNHNVYKIRGSSESEVAEISLSATGSSSAFTSIQGGGAQIGMASRRIKNDEIEMLLPLYGSLDSQANEHIVALDGLAIITHPNNEVEQLTLTQLAKIFSGEYTNWSDVGGKEGKINLFIREPGSGTRDTFKSLVLKSDGLALAENAIEIESSGDLSDLVSQDPSAIGFIGLPYVRRSKALAIAASEETLPIYPTMFTVSTEDYVLSRRLYMYTTDTYKKEVADFIDFTLSEEGQKVVKDIGLISQLVSAVHMSPSPSFPERYNDLTKMAKRLSLNFRFYSNTDELDNKGKMDIKRLMQYLERNIGSRIILVGFSDSVGDETPNLLLSKKRAEAIAGQLKMYGVSAMNVIGMGELAPVASNLTASGRNKNRRVEVWVL